MEANQICTMYEKLSPHNVSFWLANSRKSVYGDFFMNLFIDIFLTLLTNRRLFTDFY